MEFLNMVPTFPIMGILVRCMGYLLLALGLYYLGKAAWLTFRRRY